MSPQTCTLRAAIQASNACSDSHDIIELASLGQDYRIWIPGSGEDAAATGDLDVVPQVNKTLTIYMNGQTLIEHIMSSDDRLFDVPEGDHDVTLNISFGRLRFGKAEQDSQEFGGCLRALAGTINLHNVIFQECAAYHYGGAIYVKNVNLSMTACNLGDNDFLIRTGIHQPKGGALAALNSTVDIQSCNFVGNGWATGSGHVDAEQGGAIWVGADFVEEEGGYFGYLFMDDSLVEDNHAVKNGGGVAAEAPVQISGSSILNNMASDATGSRGAGIFLSAENELSYIDECLIEGNSSVVDGGGLYVYGGALSVFGTSISYNEQASNGGGAMIEAAEVLFDSSGLAGNYASYGGGIYMKSGATVEMVNTSVYENIVTGDGGAVYNDSGTLSALHTTFWANTCADPACKVDGIYAESGTTNELDRSILLSGGVHCAGPVDPIGVVMSDEYACFDVELLGTTSGMGLCPTCSVPTVTVAWPNEALSAAVPCGVAVDALGVARQSQVCDVGAWEAL